MGKSMADTLIERGRKEGEVRGFQRALLLQLVSQFGEVPAETQQIVKKTTDLKQLERWLKQSASADTLEDLHITSPA
jgi:hypothetical protein